MGKDQEQPADDRLRLSLAAVDAIAAGVKQLIVALLDRPRPAEQPPTVAERPVVNPAPAAEVQPSATIATPANVRPVRQTKLPRDLTDLQRHVAWQLGKSGPQTRAEICRAIGTSYKPLNEAIGVLRCRGLVAMLPTRPFSFRAIEPTNEPTREANAC